MQLKAPTLVALFWLGILALMWCAGCGIPITLRLETVPTVDQARWSRDMTDRINDHEERLRTLERRALEEDAI